MIENYSFAPKWCHNIFVCSSFKRKFLCKYYCVGWWLRCNVFYYEWVQKYRILCHVIGISSYSENVNIYNVLYSHRVIESSLERVSIKNIFSLDIQKWIEIYNKASRIKMNQQIRLNFYTLYVVKTFKIPFDNKKIMLHCPLRYKTYVRGLF